MAIRRVAVSGLGSKGRQRVDVLAGRSGVRVVGFDPTPELRDQMNGRGVERTVADFEALLDSGRDALVIAAPDRFHLPQLEAAAGRGIPTLVEKALAPSAREADAAVRRIRDTGTPVLVGYVLRHRPVVQAVRAALDDGRIGTPTSYQVMLGAYTTITAAVSRFATADPDRLYRDYSDERDYLRWLFGSVTLLSHAAGVTGAFHIDYVEPRGVRTMHLLGTGGSLLADLARGTLTIRVAGEDFDRRYADAEPPASALRRQVDHLLEVAAGAATSVVTWTTAWPLSRWRTHCAFRSPGTDGPRRALTPPTRKVKLVPQFTETVRSIQCNSMAVLPSKIIPSIQ